MKTWEETNFSKWNIISSDGRAFTQEAIENWTACDVSWRKMLFSSFSSQFYSLANLFSSLWIKLMPWISRTLEDTRLKILLVAGISKLFFAENKNQLEIQDFS